MSDERVEVVQRARVARGHLPLRREIAVEVLAALDAYEREHPKDVLPSDLRELLEDPGVVVRQDQRVWELLAQWQKAPSATASETPESTGQSDELSGVEREAMNGARDHWLATEAQMTDRFPAATPSEGFDAGYRAALAASPQSDHQPPFVGGIDADKYEKDLRDPDVQAALKRAAQSDHGPGEALIREARQRIGEIMAVAASEDCVTEDDRKVIAALWAALGVQEERDV